MFGPIIGPKKENQPDHRWDADYPNNRDKPLYNQSTT
jgi:hypothetical protein